MSRFQLRITKAILRIVAKDWLGVVIPSGSGVLLGFLVSLNSSNGRGLALG